MVRVLKKSSYQSTLF